MKLRHTILSAVALAVAGTSTATLAAKQNEPIAIKQWSYDSLYKDGGIEGNKLLGAEVFGSSGEEIGNIEDVLISEDNQIVAVIAEVGGFWDIADTHIAVPWKELEMTDDGFQIPVNEDNVEEYGVFKNSYVTKSLEQTKRVEDDVSGGSRIWRLNNLIGDYATLKDGSNYGYVDDVLFSEKGKIQAVVVDSTSQYGPDTYAYPYYGYGNQPGVDMYNIGYDTDAVASADVFDDDKYNGKLEENEEVEDNEENDND